MKKFIPLVLLLIAGIVLYLSCPSTKFAQKMKQNRIAKQSEVTDVSGGFYKIAPEFTAKENAVEIDVNYPPSLSYKTKSDIYKLRKQYVKTSIFNNDTYEPSNYVFGQIVNRKPWMSLNICKNSSGEIGITGASEEARWIANPSMLIGIEFPFYFNNTDNYNFCNSNENVLLPVKISYLPSKNEIDVYYSGLPFKYALPYFYDLNGVNAKDLGYNYLYVDKSKSSYDIKFTNSKNASNRVVELQNFIHLGSSCNHEGGCNNGSPRQLMLEFSNNDKKVLFNRDIYIKLWNKKPASPKKPADITERIIFNKV